ncbi:MAG: ribonuclease [Betaproteobacteria bacterium]|jgi:ribonuclease R|nr:ribonuclease [Betaproteobacteria bacterium]
MPKKRPSRIALRRRSRADRTAPAANDYARDVLRELERAGAPLVADELAERLRLPRPERRAFEAGLAALERSGEVVRNRAGALLIARRIAAVAGRVEGHPDGHGFLVPDDGAASVFLPAAEMRGVMHGDRAAVRITGNDHRGRPVGALVEVLERANRRIVGRLRNEHGVLYLAPEDRRIAHDIVVPAAEAAKAKPGQVVTIDLVQPPTKHARPVGRIAEVLGNYADSGMEIEIALRKFDLPHEFAKKALAQAQALPNSLQEKDIQGRRDLRELEFVTIDGETAKDFDDAVYARREGRDWRLWVAIADVSHYVRPGDALDLSARERGTSVYFPRRVIPMLPEKLSNGLCSLNPDVDRLAMVCEMAIGAQGEVSGYEFYPAVFRSKARLTYTKVWAELSSGKPPAPLATLYEVFKALHRQRVRRGAIDFETVETRMVFDPRGKIEKIVAEQRNDAHRLIEECMLAANVCAGNFIAERDQPVLYRVHEVPAEDRVAALRDFLAELGLQLPGGAVPRPKDYAQVLERIRTRPDFNLLQTILLRSLKRAVYTPRNVGHFGLAFNAYVHFTSPIRRYPDLLVHRALKALLNGKKYDGVDWEELGRHCSETERRADDASRDVEAWLKCYYMRDHVGEVFSGTVTGVVPFGLFVTLDDYFVDGLVHISELGRDYFQFDGARHLLYGERTKKRFRLADRLKVKLVRVDVDQRKMDLVPA